eukprot:TRINITY_DN11714_c0_g1_i7.p1 TRINITY_DN11714_c0_g1~~TRINITY_DN11714_c0_g1_i7.p1  ORF type:complete len:117 (+),score=10.97 TRINITY_DN11714_c0_g1_i7:355-705(+)
MYHPSLGPNSFGGRARSQLTVVLDMDETLVHSKLELRCPEGNTVRINDPRQAEDRSKSGEEPEVPHDFEFSIPLSPAASNGELRAVSYTHLRAHETVLDLVCRLLLEKKKKKYYYI